MSESVNEGSRMDQIEASLAKMAEHLQALTATMSNIALPRAAGGSENERRDEPPTGLNDDVPGFDDDMAEYAAGRIAGTQAEVQKLRDQVETVTRKLKGKNEDLLDYDTMTFEEQLPAHFKMPDIAKFNGNGDPRVHLRQYVSVMSSVGLSQRQVQKMFGMSLEGAPVVWYHSLEKQVKEDWRELADAFLKQYVTDLEIDLSLRDLENVKQRPEESFKEYVDRWRGQLLKMQTRPSEKDQIKMIIKGTKPSIYGKLRRMTSMIADFRQLRETVMDIEEEEAENRKFYNLNRRTVGGSSGSKPVTAEVAAIKNRRFSNLGRPLSKVLEKLMRQGLLKPLEPKPLSNPPPSNLDMSRYCRFHQQHGHDTDNCTRLRHEIQDLIDSHKIPDPEREQPSTHKNPLPNYHSVPPPTYMINSGLPESLVLETLDHQAYCLGIWDNSEDEAE